MQNNDEFLMEQWKTELFQDNALNKLFDDTISHEEFVFQILRDYNKVQVGEIYSKLTSIKSNIHTQLDEFIKKNYQKILNDIKESHEAEFDQEAIYDKITRIRKLKESTERLYIRNYQTIKRVQPILENSSKALEYCKELQKFSQQLKILRSIAQPVGQTINILDPLRVSHILQDFENVSEDVKKSCLWTKNGKYLEQVKDMVQLKSEKKFQDALQNKSLPEITQSLSIFYALKILSKQIENKVNQYLNQQNEQYKSVLSRDKLVLSDLTKVVKEWNSQSLQVWLISQALISYDQHDFVCYDDYLNYPKLFENYWEKSVSIIKKSYNLSNKEHFVKYYPKIQELYEDTLYTFKEQTLLFPQSILISVSLQNLSQQVNMALDSFKQPYQQQVQETIKNAMKLFLNTIKVVDTQNLQNYYKQCQQQGNYIIEIVKQELNDTEIVYIYKITISEFQKIVNSILAKLEESQWPQELQLILITIVPSTFEEIIKIFMTHKLNYRLDLAIIEELKDKTSNLFNATFMKFSLFWKDKLIYQLEDLQNQRYEQYVQQIQNLFIDYGVYQFQKGLKYSTQLEQFLQSFVNLFSYACIFYKLNNETINNLVQELQKVFDGILDSHQDINQQTQKQLIYLQKLFMIDIDSLQMFVEMQNEFIIIMPTSLIAFYLKHDKLSKKQIKDKIAQTTLQEFFEKTLLEKSLNKLDGRKKEIIIEIIKVKDK